VITLTAPGAYREQLLITEEETTTLSRVEV
jgi:hypothetical protein